MLNWDQGLVLNVSVLDRLPGASASSLLCWSAPCAVSSVFLVRVPFEVYAHVCSQPSCVRAWFRAFAMSRDRVPPQVGRSHGACPSPRTPPSPLAFPFTPAQGRSQSPSWLHPGHPARPHGPFRQELSRGPARPLSLFPSPLLLLGLRPCRVEECKGRSTQLCRRLS